MPSEGVANASRCTASAIGAPVASVRRSRRRHSVPVGNGGENRSMLSPDDSRRRRDPARRSATAPAVPRSVASLQKFVERSFGVRVRAGGTGEPVVRREPLDELAVAGPEALEADLAR